MPRTSKKKPEYQATPANGGISSLIKELWQAAVNLRGSVEPADYKRYVLPIIFLRFLSLRFEARRAELDRLIKEPGSSGSNTDCTHEVPVAKRSGNGCKCARIAAVLREEPPRLTLLCVCDLDDGQTAGPRRARARRQRYR